MNYCSRSERLEYMLAPTTVLKTSTRPRFGPTEPICGTRQRSFHEEVFPEITGCINFHSGFPGGIENQRSARALVVDSLFSLVSGKEF